MEQFKKVVTSPNIIIPLIILKVVTYYCLIDVNILTNFLVLASVIVLGMLFYHMSESSMKHKFAIFAIVYGFFSIIMFADTMYYNYYNQTVSVQQIYQVSNVAKVPSSFVATLIPASFFIIWDIPFALYYFKKRSAQCEDKKQDNKTNIRRVMNITCVVLILVLAVNPFENTFVTKINSVGFFSNHIRDIVDVASGFVEEEFWEPEQVVKTVKAQQKQEKEEQNNSLQGIAKDKNLIVIQLEAFQNFVIGAEYNGQELTPNLNKLVAKDSIYFDQYYSIIGKGNTADAEFATLNSLYPVIDGESYRLYTENTYNGLPWKLKDQGYATYAFHGNEGNFWNREVAYPYQGIDNFYDSEKLDSSEVLGLGVSDKSMFHQMVEVLKKEEKPFFSFAVTLTSHHPYEMPEELCKLDILPEDEGSKFSKYLQSVHYTDEAIGQLIQELKENDLYEDTVLAFYGDHHGLNCTMDNNEEYVGRYLGKAYGYEEMLKVPCIVHVPESGVNKTISTLGCQVDFLPTMASLMNFELEQPFVMGQNLLTAKDGFAAFTAYLFDGSFAYNDIMFQISREGIFEGSAAWNRNTLEAVDSRQYEKQYERAIELKEASRQVLEQDLIKDYITHKVPVEVNVHR